MITATKSILSMYIFSTHPNENVIISKIFNFAIDPHQKNSLNK